MKRVLTAVLIALFALSFTMAQDQMAKQEKNTTTSTEKKSTGCCAQKKECADMKDCPAMKETKGASMSEQGKDSKKEEVKTTETKPAEAK